MTRYFLFGLGAILAAFAVLAFVVNRRVGRLPGTIDNAIGTGIAAGSLLLAAILQLTVGAQVPACLGRPDYGTVGTIGYVATLMPAVMIIGWALLVPRERLLRQAAYEFFERAPWLMRASYVGLGVLWMVIAPSFGPGGPCPT